jgi:hypothetical protein
MKKNMVAEEVFVNCYNFNNITKVKKGQFQGFFIKLSRAGVRAGAGVEIGDGARICSRGRKKYFRLHNTAK